VAWEIEFKFETWEFVPRADQIYAERLRAIEKE
jgi:hypothetical protein